jgi:hypothetical protein
VAEAGERWIRLTGSSPRLGRRPSLGQVRLRVYVELGKVSLGKVSVGWVRLRLVGLD